MPSLIPMYAADFEVRVSPQDIPKLKALGHWRGMRDASPGASPHDCARRTPSQLRGPAGPAFVDEGSNFRTSLASTVGRRRQHLL
jgi:hypothetical protein